MGSCAYECLLCLVYIVFVLLPSPTINDDNNRQNSNNETLGRDLLFSYMNYFKDIRFRLTRKDGSSSSIDV